MEYKKEKRMYTVLTQNGLVKIKPSAESKAIAIVNLNQLLKMNLQVNKITHHHKRKLNTSSNSEQSFTEKDPKILKPSYIRRTSNLFNSTLSDYKNMKIVMLMLHQYEKHRWILLMN